jgi:hypothetical protein
MPRRRPQKRTRNGGGTISPDSTVSMSVKQMVIGGIIMLSVAAGWGFVVWGQVEGNRDISSVKNTFETAIKDIKDAFKDQDNKRGALDQKVSDVTSKLALEEQREQMIADTLTKISNQVDALRVAAPISGPGSGGGVAVGGGFQTKH